MGGHGVLLARSQKPTAMQACTSPFLLAVSFLSLWSVAPAAARPVPVPLAPCPSAQQTPPGLGPASPPASPAWNWPVARRLFADGSVSCTGADDTSQPVGAATLLPRKGGTTYSVVLRLGASMANWPYFVELSLDGTCTGPLRFPFVMDSAGNVVLTGFYPAPSGPQKVLVNVVSAAPVAPPDPKLREIAPSSLMTIAVPDDGSTLLALGFDGGSGPLPWFEQGFTFAGDGSVSGRHLSMAYLGYLGPRVTLTRSAGGTFDLVALSANLVDNTDGMDGVAWVASDRGGYEEFWSGSTELQGPQWEGITTLYIGVGVAGLSNGGVYLDADDFMVRIH